ncbi:MAG: hypothetical protein D6678_07825 [Zetaproteobacteria bacterium]|nr:MAG: hypothetical protein D6678_07825 [Zetaproteobacteria bacterium]
MSQRTIEASIEIDRPLHEVVAFVDNCDNDPLWQSSVWETVQLDEGKPAKGTRYHVKQKFLGRIIDQYWEVVERSADGTFWRAKTVAGPFAMDVTMRFEPTQGGTRVTRTMHLDVGRFFKLPASLIATIAEREVRADFETLKLLLERGR